MDIVYNHNSKSVLLLENNNQIPLEQVVTQCVKYQDLNHLHKVMDVITGKYVEHLNMIQQLLETNHNAETENDDLCQKNSEQYKIIQTSNDKIAHLEQQLQDYQKETNDKHHKLWVQLLEEKKQNEKNKNLVEEMKDNFELCQLYKKHVGKDYQELVQDNLGHVGYIENLHQQNNYLEMKIENNTTEQIENLENQLYQEKKKNNQIHQLVDELEKKNNKLWNELVYQKQNQETETDYDMLSDVSYTS